MKRNIITVDTDVLIIGGGLGGCMAAINAADRGVRVAVTDKSNTLASGAAATGIDHIWSYIPPVHEKMGYTIEDMAEEHRLGMSAGFLRKDLFLLVAGRVVRGPGPRVQVSAVPAETAGPLLRRVSCHGASRAS